MSDSPDKTSSRLAEELLSYWVRHPGADGTIEVIVEWWVLEQRLHQAASDVRSVLNDLVESGFVVERRQADGRVRYRLNEEREPEVREWLESRIQRRS